MTTLTSPRPDTTRLAGATPAPRRDRYIDTLRVLALVRVVTYHTFSWVWLPVLFPSMGVMFALAGSLVAASLDRRPGDHWRVLRKRVTRLLPPLWLFGVVVVPVMLLAGWTWNDTAGSELSWSTMLFWLLPLSDPPGSALGADWVLPLWYIRTYLWFLVLSPAALWCFRHWPKRTLAVPLGLLVAYSVGLVPLPDRAGDIVLDLAIFGACWLLGFAHHDDLVRRIRMRTVLLAALACMGVGIAWALRYPTPESGWDIDNIPLADGLYSLGAVLVLLRLYPDFSWMARHRSLDGFVTMVNSRAMTIYLWGNLAIFGAIELLPRIPGAENRLGDGALAQTGGFALAWVLIGVAMVCFGWVEDLAARRPLRLNPWPAPGARLPAPAPARRAVRSTRPGYVLAASLALAAGLGGLTTVLLHDRHTQAPAVGEAPVRASTAPPRSVTVDSGAHAFRKDVSSLAGAVTSALRGSGADAAPARPVGQVWPVASRTPLATPDAAPSAPTSAPAVVLVPRPVSLFAPVATPAPAPPATTAPIPAGSAYPSNDVPVGPAATGSATADPSDTPRPTDVPTTAPSAVPTPPGPTPTDDTGPTRAPASPTAPDPTDAPGHPTDTPTMPDPSSVEPTTAPAPSDAPSTPSTLDPPTPTTASTPDQTDHTHPG